MKPPNNPLAPDRIKVIGEFELLSAAGEAERSADPREGVHCQPMIAAKLCNS